MYYFNILIAGFCGGIIRGLVGFIKHQYAYKHVQFSWPYFLAMISLAGLIGLSAAYISKNIKMTFLGLKYLSPAMALIIGYAGGDFIENLYKIIIRKPSLYSFDNKKQ